MINDKNFQLCFTNQSHSADHLVTSPLQGEGSIKTNYSGHWINAPQVCGSKESHQRVQLQEKGEKFLSFPSSIAYILQY